MRTFEDKDVFYLSQQQKHKLYIYTYEYLDIYFTITIYIISTKYKTTCRETIHFALRPKSHHVIP